MMLVKRVSASLSGNKPRIEDCSLIPRNIGL